MKARSPRIPFLNRELERAHFGSGRDRPLRPPRLLARWLGRWLNCDPPSVTTSGFSEADLGDLLAQNCRFALQQLCKLLNRRPAGAKQGVCPDHRPVAGVELIAAHSFDEVDGVLGIAALGQPVEDRPGFTLRHPRPNLA